MPVMHLPPGYGDEDADEMSRVREAISDRVAKYDDRHLEWRVLTSCTELEDERLLFLPYGDETVTVVSGPPYDYMNDRGHIEYAPYVPHIFTADEVILEGEGENHVLKGVTVLFGHGTFRENRWMFGETLYSAMFSGPKDVESVVGACARSGLVPDLLLACSTIEDFTTPERAELWYLDLYGVACAEPDQTLRATFVLDEDGRVKIRVIGPGTRWRNIDIVERRLLEKSIVILPEEAGS